MADTTTKKFLSLDGLEQYDALIKQEIAEVNTSITNITNGSVAVKEAEHADSADEATHAVSSDSSASADVATKANQLSTARTISLTGDVSGSASFDGSADVSLTVTVADDSHNHVISNIDGLQTALDAKAATTYVDNAVSGKADADHNHDSDYDAKGAADTALASAKSYADSKVSGLASTSSVTSAISTHNTSATAHSDIRDLISALTTKVNNFLDVDDTTTDQLSEVLELIEANKGTLDSITSGKVNVSDIVDNLTTSNASKVLSAKQGVALKALIDALQEDFDGHTHAIADVTGLQSALDDKAAASHTHTVSQISDLTATASELNVLDGITATTAELNYVDGVTSNIQTQLDGKAASSHSHTITATATDDDVIVLTGTNGTNKVTFDAKHATSGVTAGTYKSVTVNAYGHVTGGSNPTTLSGYGITDAYTKTQVDSALSGKSDSGHTHSVATASANGFMSSAMFTKLSGIAEGATAVTVDSALSTSSTNPVQNSVVTSNINTLTSAVSANTSSISSHSTAISNLQTAVNEITEITSAEITALFNS